MRDVDVYVVNDDYYPPEDDEKYIAVQIIKIPDLSSEDFRDQTTCYVAGDIIEIEFAYPLSKKVIRTFHHEGGFTAYDIVRAVYDGYTAIYAAENAAVGDPGHIPGMLNRQRSEGPYGIWGHDLGDLYLEGVKVEGKQLKLRIGS